MNREIFERIANEAFKEFLDELGYPRQGRKLLCDWFGWTHSAPLDRVETEFCMDFADGREGVFPICVPNGLSEEETKSQITQQLREHGVKPGVTYIPPESATH
jgi:hypothetical protein